MKLSRLGWALLALLAVHFLVVDAVNVHSLRRRSASRPSRSDFDESADDSSAFEDEDAVAEKPAPAGPSLLATNTETADALVASLHDLVAKTVERNKADAELLNAKQATTAAMHEEIARQHEELEKRAEMVKRLETCLELGPPSAQLTATQQRLDAMFGEVKAQLAQHRDQAAKSRAQLAALEAELAAREQAVAEQERLASQTSAAAKAEQQQLDEREKNVARAELALAQKRSDFEARSLQFKQQASQAAAAAAAGSEAGAAIAAAVGSGSSLPSPLPSQGAPRFMQVHGKAAAVVSAAAKAKSQSKAKVQAPDASAVVTVTGSGLTRAEAECAALTDCAACAAAPACGWCTSPAACFVHDVNARFDGGGAAGSGGALGGDGLTSGKCAAEHWNSAVGARLSLLTLNTFGSDPVSTMERAQSVVDLLQAAKPDFVALQEVEQWLLDALSADDFVKGYYHSSDYGSGQAPGGLYILSRYELTNIAYSEQILPGQTETDMRARLLLVQALVGQKLVTVATTALDWRSGTNRAQSLDYIFSVLAPYPDVLLLGDMNFDQHSDPETSHVPAAYVDVWPTLRPSEPGFTWDPETNAYAKLADSKSLPSRIDRVFIKSTQWLGRTIKLVGCRATDVLCTSNSGLVQMPATQVPALYPSTHYGLLAEASRFTPHC